MPGIVHCQTVFTTKSHLVRDQIVHTWNAATSLLTPLGLAVLMNDAIELFYNDGLPNPPGSFLSSAIDRPTKVVNKFYELSALSSIDVTEHPTPGFGSPILENDWTLHDGAGGQPMPGQLAVAISWHAGRDGLAEHSGHGPRPAQRTRGRMYFGPLSANTTVGDPATGDGRVQAALLTVLGVNATRWLNLEGLAGDYFPVVWSRVDKKCRRVVGGFIDNEFDVQRRRGESPTFKELFGAPA